MASDTDFVRLQQLLRDQGLEEACDFLVDRLKQRKQFEQLFDARLMQCRHRLGLPVLDNRDLDQIPATVRDQLEEQYVAVCREVGQLLLDEGEFRRAWMYLRPAGEHEVMKSVLARALPDEQNLEELIELSIYEGVDPGRGFQWMLEHHGTCNSITAYESAMYGRDLAQRQLVAGILVNWLHKELLNNLVPEGEPGPAGTDSQGPIETLLAQHGGADETFGEFVTHIDVSHLTTVVRFARIITDPSVLRVAVDLSAYGTHLHESLQPSADPPFDDYFPAHRLFYAAQLGREVDPAVEYFRTQAEATDLAIDSVVPIEVYVALLDRLARYGDAVRARAQLLPPDIQTTGFAPTLVELSRRAGNYEFLLGQCQQRDDLLGYAIGQLHRYDGDRE